MSQKKYISPSKLSTFLDNLKNMFSTLGHKHTLSDLTDYTVDDELSSTSTNPVQNKVLNAELDAISDAFNLYEQVLDGKADSSHTHDDRYYTETEIDTRLASKADADAVNTALDGKQNIATYHYNGSATDAEVAAWLDTILATMPEHSSVDVSGYFFNTGESHYAYGTLYKHDNNHASLYTTSYVDEEWRIQKVGGVWQSPEYINRAMAGHTHTKADIGLGNVDNTSDMNKPVSEAQAVAIKVVQDALNKHMQDEGNPHKTTKSNLGLDLVDNTSDMNKPVSTAMQTALDTKQNVATYHYNGGAYDADVAAWLDTILATMPEHSAVTVSGTFFTYSHVSYGILYKHTNDWASLYTTSYVDEEWRRVKYDGVWEPSECVNRAMAGHTHDERYYTQSVIDTKLANISGGGSTGMVREFNSGTLYAMEFTYGSNASKIYTITVNVNQGESEDITEPIYYSFVIDYMSVANNDDYRLYWLPCISVRDNNSNLIDYRGQRIEVYLENGGIRMMAYGCRIVNVCGYY